MTFHALIRSYGREAAWRYSLSREAKMHGIDRPFRVPSLSELGHLAGFVVLIGWTRAL